MRVRQPVCSALPSLPALTFLDLAWIPTTGDAAAFNAALPLLSQLCELRLDWRECELRFAGASTLTRLSSVSLIGGWSVRNLSLLPALARLSMTGGTLAEERVRASQLSNPQALGRRESVPLHAALPTFHSHSAPCPHCRHRPPCTTQELIACTALEDLEIDAGTLQEAFVPEMFSDEDEPPSFSEQGLRLPALRRFTSGSRSQRPSGGRRWRGPWWAPPA